MTSKDYQSLIDVFFSALSNYGLQSTVLLMALDSEQMYSQNEETQDSDIELIREYKDLGRIYEHEDMLFINDKHVSFLVRGLSFDDQEKKGRLQDNLVILASGLTERIDALNLDIKMGRQRQNLHTIVKAIPKVIDKIEQDLGAQLNKTDGMCDRVIANMGSMIKDQGLGAEKEKELCGLLITHKHQLHKILAESIVIAEQFAEIMNTLERTYVSSAESDSSVETSAETSADVLFENDKAVTESVIF